MDLPPDTLLHDNRYRILRSLGHGAMGSVYLAHDEALDQVVAVKCNRRLTEESTTQFIREARILAGLHHPNLPRVIDYFVEEPNQYLVMDYIPGEDLEHVLEKEGAQPLMRVLEWMQGLGSALAYLHCQNPPIIHRDIKPGNIKLTPSGEVALVDFGIATLGDAAQHIAAGAAGLTPGYAPPEQYGAGRTGPAADQYALAATAYAMLTGQKPAESLERMLNNAALPRVNEICTDIPEHVGWAIEKAMAVHARDRFPGISYFIHALFDSSVMKKGIGAEVYGSSPCAPPRKTPARWIWAAGILGGLLIVGVIITALLPLLNSKAAGRPSLTPTPAGLSTLPGASAPETTATPSATTAPPTAVASSTPAPSFTASPTPQPSPTTTPPPLGGGGLVAFLSNRADGTTMQIYTMSVTLDASSHPVISEPIQHTFSAGSKKDLAWSPDGKTLVFSAPDPFNKEMDLWTLDMTVSDARPVRLTYFKGDEAEPNWSSDGKWIVFSNTGMIENVTSVYIMQADGSNNRRLKSDYNEHAPVFSPDMKWLLYVVKSSSHNYFFLRNQEDDYKSTLHFDLAEELGRQGEVDDPAWSPQGDYIAYTRTEGRFHRIYSVKFSSRGADMLLLTQDAFREQHPAWSRDADWIVFDSERDGNFEIYLMNPVGNLQTNLTQHPARDLQPVWQP